MVQSNVKWEIKEIKSFAEGTTSESEVIGLAAGVAQGAIKNDVNVTDRNRRAA